MAGKQARSFKWICCNECGASIIAGRPCDVCKDIRAHRAKQACGIKVGDTVRVLSKGNALEGKTAKVIDLSSQDFKNVWAKLDVAPLDSRNSNNWFLVNHLERTSEYAGPDMGVVNGLPAGVRGFED